MASDGNQCDCVCPPSPLTSYPTEWFHSIAQNASCRKSTQPLFHAHIEPRDCDSGRNTQQAQNP
jgi:hypothetical protein